MNPIKIDVEFEVSPRLVRCGLAGLLVLLSAPDLSSENVALSTYYPSPSGVYTQMITSGATYLARDGGNVGIGTTSPLTKLHVAGTMRLSAAAGQISLGGPTLSAPAANTLALTGGAEGFRIDSTGRLGLATTTPVAAVDIAAGVLTIGAAGCGLTLVGTACGGGTYSTWVPGYRTHYDVTVSPRLGAVAGSRYCCPCPSGACAALP